MAVTEAHVKGYLSNGCVDADIIARARCGQSGGFIYGEGSPYKDIMLPCGGQLIVEIIQRPDHQLILTALKTLESRQDTELKLGRVSVLLVPRLKLRIAGRGAACLALVDLAKSCGFDVLIQSPDADIVTEAQHLTNPNAPPSVADDHRTAVVCLFHDHDWEAALLQQALSSPAFYIGAMGSERTHKIRCKNLSVLGVSDEDISRIKGPIGLVPAQRDARLLAVSVLAEIIQTAQRHKLL